MESKKPHRPFRKTRLYFALSVVVLVVMCVVAFYLYADPLVNLLLKKRNISNFVQAFPDYTLRIAGFHYVPLKNKLSCDSVFLTTSDSGLSFTVVDFTLSRVGWINLLRGNALTPDYLADSEIEAGEVLLKLPSHQYVISSGRIRGSVSDSSISAENVELRPIQDDDHFFSARKYRRTRYRLAVPELRMLGTTCLGILNRSEFCARTIELTDPIIDILTNRYKAAEHDDVNPLMPHETLLSIAAAIQVDSLLINGGSLTYNERMTRGATPAQIKLDSMVISVGGISNQCCDHDSTVLRAQGRFMGTSRLDVRMAIPVASETFSMRYSGTVTNLNLEALNRFVSVAQPVRIKSGVLQRARFDVAVTNGHAQGTMRAVYEDFAIALRDKKTGSEKGLFNRIKSFVANEFKLRTDNMPDDGDMKVGVISYTRQPDDAFVRFLWFALRSGLKDVAGF